jgi:alkanesulfonate monooxygenase SsuD/methylene tetrahydromethanopterin reductase-like flavin-dependent oxidoreductase (luciferase family)
VSAARAFGVAAGIDADVAAPLAARCAELGYASVWSNDHPGAKGLETLADFAKGSDNVDLGVGVIALDRQSPEEINADIDRLGLDRDRLWLGVGAGFTKKPLTKMRESLPKLRETVPGVKLVLAAMGPKMCALGGASYDGVFFNWMTPDFIIDARAQVEFGAKEAGRAAPPIFGYVRTAVGDDAEKRLTKEESFYRDLHDGYRNHFARLGVEQGKVGVAAGDADGAQEGLAAYEERLDTIVVRGLASANLEAMGAVAEAAAPR